MDLREILKKQMGLYEEHSDCSVQEGLGNNCFRKDRKTFIDSDNTPVTSEKVTLHTLQCGHVVGGSEELLGRCQQCNTNWICIRDGEKSRCARCQKLLCPSCVKLLDNEPYCAGCRRLTLVMRGSWLLLRKLHEGLSA